MTRSNIHTLTTVKTADKVRKNDEIKDLLSKFKETIDQEILKNIEAKNEVKVYDEILQEVSTDLRQKETTIREQKNEIDNLKGVIKRNRKQKEKDDKPDSNLDEFKAYLNNLDDGSYRSLLEAKVAETSKDLLKKLKTKYNV